jgi:hypothetical protein
VTGATMLDSWPESRVPTASEYLLSSTRSRYDWQMITLWGFILIICMSVLSIVDWIHTYPILVSLTTWYIMNTYSNFTYWIRSVTLPPTSVFRAGTWPSLDWNPHSFHRRVNTYNAPFSLLIINSFLHTMMISLAPGVFLATLSLLLSSPVHAAPTTYLTERAPSGPKSRHPPLLVPVLQLFSDNSHTTE